MSKTRESTVTPPCPPAPLNRGNPPDQPGWLDLPTASIHPIPLCQDNMNSKLTIRTFEQSEIASVEISNRRLLNA
jgi:hypothetical protein